MDRRVIHRDLKPANVMLVQSPDLRLGETAKILDFGIAKITESGEGEQPLTKGVMIFGTPSYMSPEQATGQEVDSRSDLYSCGIILYEMLTGKKTFRGRDSVKLMAMQVTAPPPPFASVAPDASVPAACRPQSCGHWRRSASVALARRRVPRGFGTGRGGRLTVGRCMGASGQGGRASAVGRLGTLRVALVG